MCERRNVGWGRSTGGEEWGKLRSKIKYMSLKRRNYSNDNQILSSFPSEEYSGLTNVLTVFHNHN